MKKTIFNRSDLIFGNSIEKPTDNEIENTPTLRQAPLDMALRYGGTLTKRALGAMNFSFKKKYIVVDTKVHYLMKGWSPSIPGWHTDGVPRGDDLNPAGKGLPNIWAQEGMDSPIFHLLVSGDCSLTTFIKERNIDIPLPEAPTRDLYANMTLYLNKLDTVDKFRATENQVITWNWWELHSAEWAIKSGWRYLIRVTETDHIKPRESLDDILRFQNMVYVKSDEVGW